MSSIVKRPNGKWRARYRDEQGREHARHFDRKVDGQRWLDEVTAAQVVGKYVDPRAGKITFRDYAEQWRTTQVHREQTGDSYETRLRRSVYPIIGDMPIGGIRQSTIQGLVKQLSTERDGQPALAPSTVALTYKVVSSVFRAAVRDKRIPESPCIDVRLPTVHKTRVQPLTLDQVEVIQQTVPEHLNALVVLVAGTGVRPGEAFGVTRDRLRLLGKNPVVTVDRQLVTRKGGAKFGPLKTKASYRDVPLPRVVVRALNAHIARYEIGNEDLLFTLEGEPITRSRFWHAFDDARKAARLTDATGKGLHALRHYYASLLIRHGESVKVVQQRLGHATATETLDTYAHLWPDSDERTREAVDSVLLGALADSPRTAAKG